MWVEPITNRIAQDVIDRAQKAFFNVSDWIRITGNAETVVALVEITTSLRIPFAALPVPTKYTIPTVAELNAFLVNIDANRIAQNLHIWGLQPIDTEYIGGVSGSSPMFEEVNTWERNLAIVRNFIFDHIAYRISCGVASSGQAHFWQVRFRDFVYVPDLPTPVRSPRSGFAICGTSFTRQNQYRRYA